VLVIDFIMSFGLRGDYAESLVAPKENIYTGWRVLVPNRLRRKNNLKKNKQKTKTNERNL